MMPSPLRAPLWPLMSLLMACTPEPTGPPDLVLISLDTTRADRFGERGAADTPSVDRLATQSRTFPRATTVTNNTLPAHVSMLSGLYPQSAGVPRNGHKLPASTPWLAEHLAAAGYDTAAFVSASALANKLGLSRGFDHYDDTFDVKELDQRQRHAEETVNATMAWIAEHEAGPSADTPYFVWVHLFDPHYPYTPPEAWLPEDGYSGPADGSLEYLLQVWGRMGRDKIDTTPADRLHMVNRYNAETAYMDTHLGRLFNVLGEGPMIALTADHGESLTEHDYLFDHGEYVYQPSLHVPFVLRPPAGTALSPGPSQGLAQVLDVFPTFLSAAGVDIPKGTEGVDLTPTFADAAAPVREVAFAESCRPWNAEKEGVYQNLPKAQSAIQWPWKLIVTPHNQKTELYRLDTDPGELTNLRAQEPAQVDAMLPLLSEWRKSATQVGTKDLENIEALKALGYVE